MTNQMYSELTAETPEELIERMAHETVASNDPYCWMTRQQFSQYVVCHFPELHERPATRQQVGVKFANRVLELALGPEKFLALTGRRHPEVIKAETAALDAVLMTPERVAARKARIAERRIGR
jgi:hypothetical protein